MLIVFTNAGLVNADLSPVISSVSPISATRLQTITIQGSGFGNIQPQLLNLGDGSVDTVGGGITPIIKIYDEGSLKGWEAGVQDGPTTGSDSIGIILVSWIDTKIVLGGFGSALNTNDQWTLSPGDPLLIEVQTANGQATYSATVISSQSNQNHNSSSAGAPPIISSVSLIAVTQVQTITIQGSGFGNIQPQLLSLGDGSVDTVWDGSTPSIVVYDERNELSAGAAGNWSGFTNGPPDLIGVVLVSWTNTQITLGGFGSGLGSQFSWSQVLQGDVLQIQIQTVSGVATYNTIAVSSQSNQNHNSGSAGAPPIISSVSSIADTLLQTITIQGSGFGNVAPQTISLGDGSVDTIDGGNTPSMQIRDNSLINGWTAGYDGNGIGVILVSWSDTKIVLGGFGSALSTTGQGEWNLMPGDPIQILVKVSGAVASYSTHVSGSQENRSGTNNGPAPVITSVSPISTDLSQTIIIKGSGFGNTQSQTMSLGDGSIDTVGGGSTPVIQIHDDGWCGWEAGTQDGPTTGADSIGIILVSWTDTKIVLGGFGSALYTNGQWSISSGDPMRIVVLTAGGVAEYETKVTGSSNSTYSSTTSLAPSTPDLKVSCQSSTTFSNFRVEISGNLTDDGKGLQGLPILLSYSVDQGNTWNELTTVSTDNHGNFLAVWLPSVTGNYLLKAEWDGNTNYTETSTVINFAVLPFGEQSVFSVTSNSTISALAFNSTSGELDFTVSAPEGTTGYCDVYIPKSLISDVSDLTVFLDGNPISYNVQPLGNAWLVSFSYQTSTNKVTMGMNATDSIVANGNQFAQWIPYGVISVLMAIIAVLLASKKKQKNYESITNMYGFEDECAVWVQVGSAHIRLIPETECVKTQFNFRNC